MTDRDRLVELVCDKIQDGHCIGYCNHPPCSQCKDLADHLLANGVIVAPCKVGQIVYEMQATRKRMQEYEVTTIKYNGHYWWFTWILKDHKGIYGNVEGFSSRQIGKTVFLTKEEAEEKLKELNGNAR